MNQKRFANTVLIILVVVLSSASGYVILVKKSAPVEQQQSNSLSETQTSPTATNNPPPKVKTLDWDSLIPTMRTALKQAFPNVRIEDSRSISVYKKVDITGDGVPEALVNLGTGGATTDLITLVRIENDKLVVPLFKQKDGKTSTLIFSSGAGGSGRYGSDANLVESKNAIYSTHYSAYNESSDSCGAEAYQWNGQTKVFEFSASLSSEAGQNYCSKICSQWTHEPDLKTYFQRICH